MYFKTTGIIVYDPKAGNAANAWWVIVECPIDIVEYYLHWVKKEIGIKLNKPLFGSHISVVRGEEPKDEYKHLWRKHHGRTIEFTYSYELENNEGYWWLRVKSKDLENLRLELGFESEPEFGYHLTIGRIV